MHILSVDWDYFLPDLAFYDWGHKESPFMIEIIWHLRANNINIKTGESAIDAVWPDPTLLDGFWERVLGDSTPTALVFAESHSQIYGLIESLKDDEPLTVTNFDQHHDIYYHSPDNLRGPVDCSNWAGVGIHEGLIDDYMLVYPPWVRDWHEETGIELIPSSFLDQTTVKYEAPKDQNYDVVFVCRSGAWAPPWVDDKWIAFLQWWQQNNPQLWSTRVGEEHLETPRDLTYEKAKEMRKQLDQQSRQTFSDSVEN